MNKSKFTKLSNGELWRRPLLAKPLIFFLGLLLCTFISSRWINSMTKSDIINPSETVTPTIVSTHSIPTSMRATNALVKLNSSNQIPQSQPELHLHSSPKTIIPFTCPISKHPICKPHAKSLVVDPILPPQEMCPDYFRWIHEDLRLWTATGITQEMVLRASKTANFRLVIIDGHAYVERYRKSFQSRDTFTLWGILQLLRRYPGKLPDLDLMFDCVDWPIVKASHYRRLQWENSSIAISPPPLFRYCGDETTLDIVFPDWSFWGWPEINIKPWEQLKREIKEGNEKFKWMDREPYAYWKGNPVVSATRQELLRCNVSDNHDWNARIYAQDWFKEIKEGFKESDLASQCIHRYKIYIEGSAWSVSEKYILACDSLALVVNPRYYDFFTRGLMPVQHYWPIRDDDKCRSIKFAVEWGNNHKQKAQAIAKEASNFIQEKLKMDYVYDYMFHLLNEYAKLLKYKPTRPPKAIELCSELMACPAKGLQQKFMMASMVNTTSGSEPCTLPLPFTPVDLRLLKRRKENAEKQVQSWEQRASEAMS